MIFGKFDLHGCKTNDKKVILSPNFVPMNGDPALYALLDKLQIRYDYYEHPAVATIDEAKKYWADIEATHCKNLFFRNHKGDQHYLVIIEHSRDLPIRDLEQRLKQGKLSFASDQRMDKYLGVKPGSVSPFGLINDKTGQVHLFIDEQLKQAKKLSFHPCINTASLVILAEDFEKFLKHVGNSFEYLAL
jgi:Ala-tRNA(Pro) deacylase